MTVEEYFLLKVLRGTAIFSFRFNENFPLHAKIETLQEEIRREGVELGLSRQSDFKNLESVLLRLEAYRKELFRLERMTASADDEEERSDYKRRKTKRKRTVIRG